MSAQQSVAESVAARYPGRAADLAWFADLACRAVVVLGNGATLCRLSINPARDPSGLPEVFVRVPDEAGVRAMADYAGVEAAQVYVHDDGAVTWSADLDGLSVLVAAHDPDPDPDLGLGLGEEVA